MVNKSQRQRTCTVGRMSYVRDGWNVVWSAMPS